MLLSELDVKNGRCFVKDGGVGSGIKGHVTAEQMKAMKERKKKVEPSPSYRPTVLGDTSKIAKSISDFDYDSFSKSKDPNELVKKLISNLGSSLGISPKINVATDQEFNNRFKNAKMSDVGKMLGGVNAVKAGYTSNDDTIWIRQSKVTEALKSRNDFRLFENAVFHEMGHAYHSEKLGVTQQDLKSEYGSGWAEEFANTFSSTLAFKKQSDRIKKNPSAYPSKQVENNNNYDFSKSIDNNLKPLIEQASKIKRK